MRIRTLTLTSFFMLQASFFCYAVSDTSLVKEKMTAPVSTHKTKLVTYTFKLDNTVNKNSTVDSVLVILDKFNLSGAGVVAKVFYPGTNNKIVIENLEAGKYYADIYVLGVYQKHFSSVIHPGKSSGKYGGKLRLDFIDMYSPGQAAIPPENPKYFAYTKQ